MAAFRRRRLSALNWEGANSSQTQAKGGSGQSQAKDRSGQAQTKGPTRCPRAIWRASLPVHAGCGARSPHRHHAADETMDHSEGVAHQRAEAGEVGCPRGVRRGRRPGEGWREVLGSLRLRQAARRIGSSGRFAKCRVFPLLVTRQSEVWPEVDQRTVQWVEPGKAVSLIKEPELKKLVAAFAKRVATAASKSVS